MLDWLTHSAALLQTIDYTEIVVLFLITKPLFIFMAMVLVVARPLRSGLGRMLPTEATHPRLLEE